MRSIFTEEELAELAEFDRKIDREKYVTTDAATDELELEAKKARAKNNKAERYYRYYAKNRDKIIARNKKYAADHKERIRAWKHQYYLTHKDEYVKRSHEGYMRKKERKENGEA